jgi:pre-mRNA-splicing factor ATP-dependent RNA helicase DHX38/PRP16
VLSNYIQADTVLPVKDPTSDMPTIARKGSSLVKEYRQKRDENKSRERFWEVAGSKIGDIIGVKKADGSAPEGDTMAGDDGEVDYKADSRCV